MSQQANLGLGEQIEAALAAAELFVGVEETDVGIELRGEVDSEENRQAAIDLATMIAGPARVTVIDSMEIQQFLPDDLFSDEADGTSITDEHDRERGGEPRDIELEADFTGDVGTTNVISVVEDGATYFAPTDPVVEPIDGAEEIAVVGGFEETSLDGLDGPTGPEDDDLIARRVVEALRRDALTTDLDVRVVLREGTIILLGEVPSIDDVEAAEAVAGEVAGGLEVEEQLTITPVVP